MSASAPIPTVTVEIVDDHFLFAQALGGVVGEQPGWTVVGLAVTAPQALAIAKERQPQVILLDYHLPGADADALIPRLRQVAPSAKIIILTGDTSDGARRNAQAAGANGFLTKETAVDDVIEMVGAVLRGATATGPPLAEPSAPTTEAPVRPLPAPPSPRAEDVATVAEGWAGSAPEPVDTSDGVSEELMEAIDALLRGTGGAVAPGVEREADLVAPAVAGRAIAHQQVRGEAPGEALVQAGTASTEAPDGRSAVDRATAERSGEVWSRRLEALAPSVRAQALAVALPSGAALVPFAAWGLALGHDPAWLQGPVAAAAGAAFARRAMQHQPQIAVPLADGRTAVAALAAPVTVHDGPAGVVIALRASEPFTRADATPMAAVAEAVAAALAEADALRRAEQERAEARVRVTPGEEERTHALALHEVTRALADSDDESGMGRAALVISGTLDADVVGIWLSEPDGRLRCAAAHGYPSAPPPLRVDTDTVLVRVALGQRTETAHYDSADAPLWAGGASYLLLAPITAAGIVRGVLVEGRRGRGFSAAEVELAPRLAATIGSLDEARAVAPPATPGAAPAAAAAEGAALDAAPEEPDRSQGGGPIPHGKGRGAYGLMIVALILAVATTAAGLAGLGPAAYLATVALVFVALLSVRL